MQAGDTIAGNLDYLGWLVIKGVTMSPNVSSTLKDCSSSNKWNRIGRDHGASMKFGNKNHTKAYSSWMHNPLLVENFDILKSNVINRYSKDISYVIGSRNIIMNRFKIETNQIPHTDYKVIME